MNFITQLFFLIFLWGNVWGVPAILAGKRRRGGKPMYGFLLITVMAIELLLALVLLQISDVSDQLDIGVYASPVIASVAGGFMYWWFAARKDKMTAN